MMLRKAKRNAHPWSSSSSSSAMKMISSVGPVSASFSVRHDTKRVRLRALTLDKILRYNWSNLGEKSTQRETRLLLLMMTTSLSTCATLTRLRRSSSFSSSSSRSSRHVLTTTMRGGRGREKHVKQRAGKTKTKAKSDDDDVKQDMNASNIGQPIDAPINPITAEPLVKGQVTAIVTGVISVLIAVGYLVLVQVMDSRDMVPPVEEEAYGDGSVPAKVVVSAAESKSKNNNAIEWEMVEME